MMEFVEIPFIRPLAEWIWGADASDEVSPEICLSQIPFISSGCFSQLLTKALGMAIIVGSCLNKAPIIINMMKSQSATGISRNSLYGEAIVYANGAFYGFLEGHPFTAYGENASLFLQNVVLVAMAWQLSSSPIKTQEKGMVIAGFAIYFLLLINFLPEDMRYMLMSATWPVMLYARGSQVLETFQVKHTGNLSIVTTGMNLVGALIRVGTTLKETGDTVVLSGYILSLLLSFVMFVQYWMYYEKTSQVAQEMKDAKAKKAS
jgi:mannose-P-dolichol utilization defect protein 1